MIGRWYRLSIVVFSDGLAIVSRETCGPGSIVLRAHSALNVRLLLDCLGVLVNDDTDAFAVDDVLDAMHVAATGHEVDNVGA